MESGIPSFRGSQGMWTKYDPMEYATLHAFMQHPGKVWEMLSEMVSVCGGAMPNPAHRALAALEERGSFAPSSPRTWTVCTRRRAPDG